MRGQLISMLQEVRQHGLGFPVHDLPDLGVEVPQGPYTTVAGFVLDRLGSLPSGGERVQVGAWEVTVEQVEARAITRVGLRRRSEADAAPARRRDGRRA
ncbi:MAG: hypothetical protein H0V19_03995 [Euzebyales bacterium]|nr:hypothetical protein [Euzebyales bacterium]MBA3620947.1 hypothetical protein [Euzebyales bacterium]